MNARTLNRTHQRGLVARVRAYSKDIRAAVRAGNISEANALASCRMQLAQMAVAAGCKPLHLNAAMR